MWKTRKQGKRQATLAGRYFDPLLECLAADAAEPAQRIGNGIESGEARIDTVTRVLEYHLDSSAIAVTGEDPRRV